MPTSQGRIHSAGRIMCRQSVFTTTTPIAKRTTPTISARSIFHIVWKPPQYSSRLAKQNAAGVRMRDSGIT